MVYSARYLLKNRFSWTTSPPATAGSALPCYSMSCESCTVSLLLQVLRSLPFLHSVPEHVFEVLLDKGQLLGEQGGNY